MSYDECKAKLGDRPDDGEYGCPEKRLVLNAIQPSGSITFLTDAAGTSLSAADSATTTSVNI